MKHAFQTLLTLIFFMFSALPGLSNDPLPTLVLLDASEASLDSFIWTNRVLLVFADNSNDPRFASQMELINADPAALRLRDVVVITDTTPSARSNIRQKYRSRGFSLVLLSKDGTVVLRKPRPWDTREISRAIDKLPLRQQEIRNGS